MPRFPENLVPERSASAEGEATPERVAPTEHDEPGSWPVAFRALRHRNFRLFVAGQLVSLIGSWMQTIAQAWLVYRLTHSALMLGAVTFTSQFPIFLLSPLGGAIADRYSRHRIVVFAQTVAMAQALLLAALTLSGVVQIWQVFALAGLLGIVGAFDVPARQSFLVEMVGRDDLMNAIALNSSMFNGARIVGPAIAGLLLVKIGEGWCFAVNGLSFLAVLAGLLMMKIHPRLGAPQTGSAWRNLVDGMVAVWSTKPVRALLLLVGMLSLVGMPFTVLMPLFADVILHVGAPGLGVLMGATGIGAIAGAMTLAARSSTKGLGRWVAISALGFGVTLAAFSQSQHYYLSVALLLPVGYCMMLATSSSNTLIQSMVPDSLRGRAVSLYSMMFIGMPPFGALIGGAIAHRWGAPLSVLLGGMGCVAAAAVFFYNLNGIRSEARDLIRAQREGL